MKANKALKRLAKIEALISDVTERYSASAPHVRDVLQDAKAAVARAKEAVRLRASAGKSKKSAPIKKGAKKAAAKKAAPAQTKAAVKKVAVKVPTAKTPKAERKAAAKKAAPAQTKAAVKRVAAKVPRAKTARRSMPIETAARKTPAKKTAQVPVQAATEVATQEPMPAELTPSVPGSSEVPSNT